MNSYRLYADARKEITLILAEIRANHFFNQTETNYKILHIEEEMVVLEIHAKLKRLAEEEYVSVLSVSDNVTFLKKSNTTWKMILKSRGFESFFFVRLLKAIKRNLDEKRNARIQASKKNVLTLLKKKLSELDPGNKHEAFVGHKDNYFYARIINNKRNKLTIQRHSPYKLLMDIMAELPVFIQNTCTP